MDRRNRRELGQCLDGVNWHTHANGHKREEEVANQNTKVPPSIFLARPDPWWLLYLISPPQSSTVLIHTLTHSLSSDASLVKAGIGRGLVL